MISVRTRGNPVAHRGDVSAEITEAREAGVGEASVGVEGARCMKSFWYVSYLKGETK